MICEQCGCELGTTAHGTPRYRCIIILRPGRPPLSRKCCPACWAQAVAAAPASAPAPTPARRGEELPAVADLPLFAEVAA